MNLLQQFACGDLDAWRVLQDLAAERGDPTLTKWLGAPVPTFWEQNSDSTAEIPPRQYRNCPYSDHLRAEDARGVPRDYSPDLHCGGTGSGLYGDHRSGDGVGSDFAVWESWGIRFNGHADTELFNSIL